MKYIKLTQGKKAMVDDEDYKELSKYRWYTKKYTNTEYAARQSKPNAFGKRHTIRMHRHILKPPHGFEVDHIDGNGLNNVRANLRVCSHAENMRNRLLHKNNTSGYTGVSFHKSAKKWRARVDIGNERIEIGYFNSVVDASNARNAVAKKVHGVFTHK